MKLATFFVSRTSCIFIKLLKAKSHLTLLVILLSSAVIYKQNFLDGKEIVQYL